MRNPGSGHSSQGGRLSVVTGANSGIGLEVAAGLRAAGHHVLLACRRAEACAAAKAELDGRRLSGSCECASLDLSDFNSVRRFAQQLGAAQVAVLVNNAGVMGAAEHSVPNHYGPYLLTRLLLPLMEQGGRVVTVASEAHRRGQLRIECEQQGGSSGGSSGGGSSTGGGSSGSGTGDSSSGGRLRVAHTPSYWYAAYAQSKLMNVLMTAELARRLTAAGSSVTCSSVSPGRVATNIFENVPGVLRPALRWLAGAAFQTPAQGARTVLHAALAPELAGRHELYLHDCRPAAAAPAARDPQLAAQLWQLSNQEVRVTAAEDAALWPSH